MVFIPNVCTQKYQFTSKTSCSCNFDFVRILRGIFLINLLSDVVNVLKMKNPLFEEHTARKGGALGCRVTWGSACVRLADDKRDMSHLSS